MTIFLPILITAGLIIGEVFGLHSSWNENHVDISGYTPTPCHQLTIDQYRVDNTALVDVYTIVNPKPCLQTLVYFETSLDLSDDIDFLIINGISVEREYLK